MSNVIDLFKKSIGVEKERDIEKQPASEEQAERILRKKMLHAIEASGCSDWCVGYNCSSVAVVCAAKLGISKEDFLTTMEDMYDEVIELVGREFNDNH